jgi:hypothetical protein
MSKKRLNDLIKDINKENAPPDGWKPEDKIEKSDNEKLANSFGLELSDFSDDGSDLDELRDIMEGN